jgi:hypothetical protein
MPFIAAGKTQHKSTFSPCLPHKAWKIPGGGVSTRQRVSEHFFMPCLPDKGCRNNFLCHVCQTKGAGTVFHVMSAGQSLYLATEA